MSFFQGPMNLSSGDENSSLLEGVIELLESQDYDSPEVILLIGRSGAGKRALINTIHKVLTGKYHPIAKQKSGLSASVTMNLNRYVNCGVSPSRITNERLKAVLPKLPHIFDCAGLEDENSEKLREQLELLLGGYIRPRKGITALDNLQESNVVGGLRKLFNEPHPAWKVSKIVFMQGCIDAIPRNLIECLRGVLNSFDKKTLQRKYHCDVFVLITKYDLVKDSKDSDDLNLHRGSEERSFTLKDLEKVETTLKDEFNFVGNRKFSRILWASLSDDVGFDNRYIENIALKFLKRIVERGVLKEEDTTPLGDSRSTLHLRMRRRLPKLLVAVSILVAVVALFYSLLK